MYIPTSSITRPSQIYPNWYFCFQNMPSGNPGCERKLGHHQGDQMCFWKNRTKRSPTRFCQNQCITSTTEKGIPKMHIGYFSNFQKSAQRKQSPNGLKFAQSGHPGYRDLSSNVSSSHLSDNALTQPLTLALTFALSKWQQKLVGSCLGCESRWLPCPRKFVSSNLRQGNWKFI
jgi:hypothetical protein